MYLQRVVKIGMLICMKRLIESIADKRRRRSAQAMIEYVVLAGMLTACIAMFAVFLVAFKEHGGRVLDLVAADYP